ncbi:MAG TPA: hypothetical protein VIJ75_13520 [Hanamia sp.]
MSIKSSLVTNSHRSGDLRQCGSFERHTLAFTNPLVTPYGAFLAILSLFNSPFFIKLETEEHPQGVNCANMEQKITMVTSLVIQDISNLGVEDQRGLR